MTADLGRSDAHDSPSDAELDASDLLLTSIAAGATSTDTLASDPLAELLRTASGPAGVGELVGEDRFVAAVSSQDAPSRRTATSPAVLVGKAVAAKAAVIAAVTVLGIAGAGAATGVILHVANDDAPQPVVTVDDPDATPPDARDVWQLSDSTLDARSAGAGADPFRVRTCAAATSPTGLEQLARAATAASTATDDFCSGTGTAADPDRPEAPTAQDDSSSTDEPMDDAPRRDPDGRAADPGPPADSGGGNGGNGGSNQGNATPGTPNTNANPKAGNGADNRNDNNAGGANTGAPNGGGNNGLGSNQGNATPGAPNTNANPKAGNGADNAVGEHGAGSTARAVAPEPSRASADRAGPDAAAGRHRAPQAPQAPDTATPRPPGVRSNRGR